MKTALLICDHVPTELSVVHGDYLEMFNQLLRDVDLDPFYVIDGQFPNPSDYDTFVVTGSKFSIYDKISWIDDLKKLTEQIYHVKKKMVEEPWIVSKKLPNHGDRTQFSPSL